MARPIENQPPGLPALLSELTHDFQRASGADIVSLSLLDNATRTYFAPFVLGLPDDGMIAALADQTEQLSRYDTDRAQGKAPDDLHIRQYGASVWLAVVQKTLVAENAPSDVDSTFVRRHHIASMVGLPLLVHHRFLGHVYLNFSAEGEPKPPDARLPKGEMLRQLESLAADSAHRILDGLADDERAALLGSRRLAQLLATPAADDEGDGPALRRRFAIALSELLYAIDQAAAAVYRLSPQGGTLDLVSAQAPIAVPLQIQIPEGGADAAEVTLEALRGAARNSGLTPVIAQRLGAADQDPRGYLVVLSRDPLARVRWAPATDTLLGAAADLITGALASEELIGDLERGNRLLGALSQMTTTILRPGASRQQVLEAVAQRLTDASAPEFDFDFATVNLVGERPDGGLAVRATAGASTVETIRSQAVADGATSRRGTRVPVWALTQDRALMADDVLAFSAAHWQTVIVGPEQPDREEGATGFLEGYPADQMRMLRVPVQRRSGEVIDYIPIALIGDELTTEPAGMAPPPFTLDAEIFVANRHGELIRIFLPFGLDTRERATGVLEVGYHRCVRDGGLTGPGGGAAGGRLRRSPSPSKPRVSTRRRAAHAEQLELAAEVSQSHRLLDRPRPDARAGRPQPGSPGRRRPLPDRALRRGHREAGTAPPLPTVTASGRGSRGERKQHGFLFEVLERGEPLHDRGRGGELPGSRRLQAAFGVRSLMALPLRRRRPADRGRHPGRARPAAAVHAGGGAAGPGPGAPGGGRDQERAPPRACRGRAPPAEGLRAPRLRPVGAEGLPAPAHAEAVLQLPDPRRRSVPRPAPRLGDA